MKLSALVFVCAIWVAFNAGCEESLTRQTTAGDSADVMRIDERVVLAASGDIRRVAWEDGVSVFDLTGVALVEDGEFNDFEITYGTPSSCDRDVWVFNNRLQTWDQIGFSPPAGVACLAHPSRHGHLFSAKGLEAEDYLDENSVLLARVSGDVVLRALVLNPKYHAVPLPNKGTGFTIHEGAFLLSSRAGIYRLSFSGELLEEYAAPTNYPFDLTSDGEKVWLADGTDQIFALDDSMSPVCAFSVPTDYPGGLAWAHRKLWLTEYQGSQLRTLVINPDESCASGSAAIEMVFPTPGGESRAIASDGRHMIVLSDRLYKMTMRGKVVESYELPIHGAASMTWHEGTIWILHSGPRDLRAGDAVISRFHLP